MIAVLCCEKNSVYKQFPETDCYDVERNAFNFTGDYPVIVHPPCRHFSNYKHFANPTTKEIETMLAMFCVEKLKKNGGILEHPKGSSLFKLAGLPFPNETSDNGELKTIQIDQYWFGFKTRKRTWLCFSKIDPSGFFVPYKLQPYGFKNGILYESMSRTERLLTPYQLADEMIKCIKTQFPSFQLVPVLGKNL